MQEQGTGCIKWNNESESNAQVVGAGGDRWGEHRPTGSQTVTVVLYECNASWPADSVSKHFPVFQEFRQP